MGDHENRLFDYVKANIPAQKNWSEDKYKEVADKVTFNLEQIAYKANPSESLYRLREEVSDNSFNAAINDKGVKSIIHHVTNKAVHDEQHGKEPLHHHVSQNSNIDLGHLQPMIGGKANSGGRAV